MLTKIECPDCKSKNDRNRKNCKGCGVSLGFPNVNILSDPYFQEELTKNYDQIVKDCNCNAITPDIIKEFEQIIINDSNAVLNINSKLLFQLVNYKEDYLPYQRAVREGKREIAEFENDRKRCFIESAFYGIIGGELNYAALSLDDNGLLSYGNISVILHCHLIKNRTTVFIKNTFKLFDELVANGWKISEPIPSGYSGTWNERGAIATIKHGKDLSAIKKVDYVKLILKSTSDKDKDEFIELHIFNPITLDTFKRVKVHSTPKNKFEENQLLLVEEILKKMNIEFICQ